MKKRLLIGFGALAIVATLAVPAVTADGPRPPKEAIDQLNNMLVEPSENGAGIVDPNKGGAALVLRDPQTGHVLRDPTTGLPLLARDEHGNVKLYQPQDVPAEQRVAQAKYDERMKRAGAGDVQAQMELKDETDKTQKAIKEHPNGGRP